jgi:hypothetical protein
MALGRLTVMVVRTLAFVIVQRVLGLIGAAPAPDAKDVEFAALASVDGGAPQVARPRYTPQDRLVLVMLGRLLPREQWPVYWACTASASG